MRKLNMAIEMAKVKKLAEERSGLVRLVGQIETYLREREDVLNGPYGRPRPNWAMEMRREFRGGFNWAKGLR